MKQPVIDLLANGYRWHLYDRGALIVPLASVAMRKYVQQYSDPWGASISVGGRRLRLLERRAAMLHLPWSGPKPVTLVRLWLDPATSGQVVQVRVNGRSLGSRSVEAGLGAVDFPVSSPKVFRQGDNDVLVSVRRRGARGSYGYWHSVVLLTKARAPAAPPPVNPVNGTTLRGFSHMRIYVEVPKHGSLVLGTAAEGAPVRLRTRLTTADGWRQTLLDTRLESGQRREHRLKLQYYGGQLVALDLETDQPRHVRWVSPRIEVETVEPLPRPAGIDNVILLVVDALRADRLRSYNPQTPVATPRINADSDKHGIVFAFNQAASSSSPPSHGSIQTGMIPRVHGVVGDNAKLQPGTPMLSTQLRAQGVAVGYFGNNPFGMARLERPGQWTAFHQPVREGKGSDCTTLMSMILDFATSQKAAGRRFVVSALPYEPHTSYRYHPGITDKYFPGPYLPPVGKNVDGALLTALTRGKVTLNATQWKQLKALYNGEVEYFDRCYGQLVDGLAQRGLSKDTAVVITADHGEGMFEHGRMGHAYGQWGELTNVPLVLLVPGWPARPMRIETVSSHIDLVPTLLDLLGLKVSPRVQGMSLLPLVLGRDRWTPRVVSSEYGRSYSLRALRWHYVVDYAGKEELFDLYGDPKEQYSVLRKASMALRYLREAAGFFLAYRSRWHAASWGDFNNHRPQFVEQVGR